VASDAREEALALVDHGALTRFLGEHVPSFHRLDVDLLAGGASNLTYLVTADDRKYVLRRRPLGRSAPKAHDMHREYRVLDALGGRGLPTPSVYAYHPDDDIVGAPFYVMDFSAGLVLHAPEDASPLDAEQAKGVSHSLVETLVALHGIGEADLQLDRFGRPEGFLERRITSWLKQWNAVEHRDFPSLVPIGQTLLSHLPEQRGSTLVHGDYRLGNVIIDLDLDGKPGVAAVLDWEMSTIGDPLTDLAHLLVYWEPTCGRVTHPAQLIARQPGFLTGEELVALYQDRSGRDLSDIDFYLAFEHWRAAIIKDAIYLRRTSGAMAADDDTEEFGRTVGRHLEEAEQILDGLGLKTAREN
jgi:aminoglycoside phosphotransferase (APT) family kinase protein